MPYDEIPQVAYQPWQDNTNYEQVIKKENEKIKNNATLTLLNNNLQWLSKNAELPVSLNYDKYRARQKQIISTVNQNNTLLKPKQEMNVAALAADKDKFYNNPDEQKGLRYQEWLKSLKNDMHIDETVNMVSEMSKFKVQTVLK